MDAERRAHTMRNHTGTHLLHRALRNVVGERARQAGSLVTPDYLRFDFPFDRALTDDEKRAIEDEVHRIIRDDRPVSIAFMSMAEAIEGGADAFFDEKYGETVRTIRVQDYSFELCGGTHCRASGQIGGFLITGERSIGSGMRRIEAVTGRRRRRPRPRAVRRARAARRTPLGAQTLRCRARTGSPRSRTSCARRSAGSRPAARPASRSRASSPPRPRRWRPGVRLVGRRRCRTTRWTRSRRRPATSAARSAPASSRSALDADEPQLFVTVSDDLVARGIAAGDLVTAAMPAHRRAGWRPSRRWPRAGARGATGLPDALAAIRAAPRERGLMAFWRRIWQRDGDGGARRLHGARRRHGVRQGARLRHRRERARHRPRRRAQAPGPVAHAVGDGGRHRGGRRQLRGRPPGGRGDGRLPADPGRHRHRRRAGQGLHHDPQPGAQEARPADHRGRAPEAHRRRPARGAPRGGAGDHLGDRACRTSTSGSSTPR